MASSAETPSLEDLFTSPHAFGVTDATPVQRAICRAIDGRSLGPLARRADVRRVFGGKEAVAALPRSPPREVVIAAGIRSGKSLLAAAVAVRAARTADLSRLLPGETARMPIVSVDRDKARVVFDHLVGTLRAKPALRALMASEPSADTVALRHPSGRLVEVMVTAGARAGASLVGRWLAGCVFDEAPRMAGIDDGVVNLEHSRDAILGRMLPGAQILYPGSPWAPIGPVYEWVTTQHGRPTEDMLVVVARGRDMNPGYWTDELCERLKRQRPAVYRTDALAEFAEQESGYFSADRVQLATRADSKLPPVEGQEYVAAMDPATRNDSWTLAVVTSSGQRDLDLAPCFDVALAIEWTPAPGAPLRPAEVMAQVADALKPYGVTSVFTDQWAADALRDLGANAGLDVVDVTQSGRSKHDMVADLRVLLDDGEEPRITLPDVPHVRDDLLSVKRRVTLKGVTIVFPRRGSRHCDFVAAIALCLYAPPGLPVEEEKRSIDPFFEKALGEPEPDEWIDGAALRVQDARVR